MERAASPRERSPEVVNVTAPYRMSASKASSSTSAWLRPP
jgi:hypothetical protein